MQPATYNIDANALKAFLQDNGLMVVDVKMVREIEEVKHARYLAKMWRKEWLTPGEIIKMDVLKIKSTEQVRRWCENGTIRKFEYKKTTNGYRILPSAVKRLAGLD